MQTSRSLMVALLLANTGVALAESHTANVQQNGGFNVVNLNQGGELSARNQADIQQSGSFLNAQVTQQNDADDRVRVLQTNGKSAVEVNQAWGSRRLVDIEQRDGGYDRVQVDQGPGSGNETVVRQSGLRQDTYVHQDGGNHRIDIEQDSYAAGQNTLTVRQDGLDGKLDLAQHGDRQDL